MEALGRPAEPQLGAFQYILRKDVLRRCSLIAIIVGCVLTIANQYDSLLEGAFTLKLAAKIAVNFLVPFVVSSTSAAVNRPDKSRR